MNGVDHINYGSDNQIEKNSFDNLLSRHQNSDASQQNMPFRSAVISWFGKKPANPVPEPSSRPRTPPSENAALQATIARQQNMLEQLARDTALPKTQTDFDVFLSETERAGYGLPAQAHLTSYQQGLVNILPRKTPEAMKSGIGRAFDTINFLSNEQNYIHSDHSILDGSIKALLDEWGKLPLHNQNPGIVEKIGYAMDAFATGINTGDRQASRSGLDLLESEIASIVHRLREAQGQ